jgi:hypothetical protein
MLPPPLRSPAAAGAALRIARRRLDSPGNSAALAGPTVRVHRFLPDPASPAPDAATLAQTRVVKAWVRACLGLGATADVALFEVPCVDAGCPLVETTVVVMEPHRTRRWTFTRPKAAITKIMVQQTLATPPRP